MADINGAILHAEDITYTITYTAERPNNFQMTYHFTISSYLDPSGFLIVGTALLCTVTINGSSSQTRIKESQFIWNGGQTHNNVVSVTCDSTAGGTNQGVIFDVVSDGTSSTTSGVIHNSTYTVTSLPLLTTACSPPTVCSLDVTVAETIATLSWSGAAGGVNNDIIGYEIEYSESSNNTTWGSWVALAVVESDETFGGLSVSPPTTRGYYRRFRVRTRGSAGASYYSTWIISSNSVRRNLWPIQPTSVTASPTSYTNETITVTWSGASSPTSSIKGYMIARRTSTDNATWSSWVVMAIFDLAATGGSRIETPLYIPGIYLQYGVWTIDAFDIYSSEEISNSIFCALSTCGAPTSCEISAALAEENVTLSWSGASGGTGNDITAYEVQYADSTDNTNWGAWAALSVVETTETYGSLSVSPTPTRGNYRRFRVRTCGSIGEVGYSGWTISDNSVRRKRLPPAPDVAAPANASAIYNTMPRVLITTGTEPDGQMQIVEVNFDGGEWMNSMDDPELFSESGELVDNTRTVFMGTMLSVGSHTVTIRCYDSATETRGTEVVRSFTVLASPFDEIIANVTHVRAAHIIALRTAVNAVRGYYGFGENTWNYNIIAGRTYVRDWPYHILELRGALIGVTALVRAYGGTTEFGLPDFEWITIGTGRPRADVMTQLSDILLYL